MQGLVHLGELARHNERPLAQDGDREPQRFGDAHRRLEERDGPILPQCVVENAEQFTCSARQKTEKAERAPGEATGCERCGDRRRAGYRGHTVPTVQRGANQDGAGIADHRRSRIGAQRECLSALQALDQLRDAASLVERGQ
jgi:hypothetical protein